MLAAAWDASPDGGSSGWVNKGDCFEGTISGPGGYTERSLMFIKYF